MNKGYYEILGISRSASQEEISQAFRRLSRKHHPDLHGSKKHAEFAKLSEAYQVLSNPELRRKYDAQLDMGFTSNQRNYQNYNNYYQNPNFNWEAFWNFYKPEAQSINLLFMVNVFFTILITTCVWGFLKVLALVALLSNQNPTLSIPIYSIIVLFSLINRPISCLLVFGLGYIAYQLIVSKYRISIKKMTKQEKFRCIILAIMLSRFF